MKYTSTLIILLVTIDDLKRQNAELKSAREREVETKYVIGTHNSEPPQ